MKPAELYQAGKLEEAIAAATAAVKASPNDIAARNFFCEMLCFAGELERCDKQLEVMMTMHAQHMVGISLFRQLVHGEQHRQDFHFAGRVPEFLGLPTDEQKLRMEANIVLREGRTAEAKRLLDEAEGLRPAVHGTLNGEAFTEIRDLDDMTSSFFEVLTSTGKYYWIGFERIEYLELRPLESPRDLLFRRAHMIVRDGPDGEVYLPALYAGSAKQKDVSIRLGRATDWVAASDDAPVRGLGQKSFLIGDKDVPLHELTVMEFASPS